MNLGECLTLCNSSCPKIEIPVYGGTDPCIKANTRPGGLPYLVIAKCVPTILTDITNVELWEQAFAAGEVAITGKLLGEKGAGSENKKKTNSCDAEETVSVDKVFTFQDYNSDPENFSIYEFYNALMKNQCFMKFGTISCSGLFRGWLPGARIFVDDVVEQNCTDNTYFAGNVGWSSRYMEVPIDLSELAFFNA